MIALRRVRLRLRSAQEGMAMLLVIGVAAVMTLLVMTGVVMSLGTMNKATDDADWNAALAAAFAGLEEYQSKLSEEPGYVQYGNPASPFSSASTVHLPTPTNPAFGLGKTGTWAIAHGEDDEDGNPGPELFRYRYEVDNSTYSATGNIRVRATGLVGGETRSLVADVRQAGFIDYVYFTNFEMGDPTIPGSGTEDCTLVKWYEGRTPATSTCRIQFISADQLHGPVHSNDTLFICGGASFDSVVTTAKPGGGFSAPPSGGTCNAGAPNFAAGPPVYAKSVPMPATNGELIRETRTDIPDEVPRPGCLYTGPTSITFITGGKMTVKSPWTKAVTISNAAGTTGDNGAAAVTRCGSVAALQSSAGATINVVKNNVVYVQNIPLTGVNGSSTASTQTTSTSQTKNGVLMCKKNDSTGTIIGNDPNSATNSYPYAQNVVGFPANGGSAATIEVPLASGTGATASYGCRNGDVFVKGTNSGGPITIGAQNYVYVTGDLRYANEDTDMIGLVGQNAVWVYNPTNSSNNFLVASSNRRIDAAILSVAHTFTVQRHNVGSVRGTLTVYGSIAQMYRGPVGTSGSSGTTGYTKNYLYDPRYRYSAPPKFLAPSTTTYGISVWVEISPVFHADGSCQLKVLSPDTCI